MFYRHVSIRAEDMQPAEGGLKRLRILASTDAPVSMGGWREVLSHADGAIDTSSASALLLNHKTGWIAGALRSFDIDGKQMFIGSDLDESATLESGMTAARAVDIGALRGASVGYDYERKDCVYDEQTNTVTVNKWRLLELSLTPTPADAACSIRSVPFDFNTQTPAPVADLEKERHMSETKNDNAQEVADLKSQLAHARCEANVRARAAEAGVSADGIDFTKGEVEGLNAIIGRMADKARSVPEHAVVKVTADAGDKLMGAAAAALYRKANLKADGEDAELIAKTKQHGASLRDVISSMAKAEGVRDTSAPSLAAFAREIVDLRTHGRRDAPNKITAQFSNILANVSNKAVLAGLNGYNAATWQAWCTQRMVADFKSVTNAGLASGRLSKTPEGEAFPELTQADGGYNSTLGLYGATVSLSYQALVNDDLGQFMAELRRAGAIAALTIDRQAYYALLNATWTNDLTTSAGLGTAGNLDKTRAALKGKLSPAGEKMGVIARFLLHDPAKAIAAQQDTGIIYAPGQTSAPSLLSRTIVPIESHWISDTSLKAGVANTDYYLTGDPSVNDTVLVNFLEGVGMAPIIMPFDAGAAAAEKWKIMVPFEATVATHTDSASAARISGMQKATA